MPSRLIKILVLIGQCAMFTSLLKGDRAAPFVTNTTLTTHNTRGLATVLERIENAFLQPITFEELPYENAEDLRTVTISNRGVAKHLLANPIYDFSVTLTSLDATPYLAAQSVLGAFTSAGGRGQYVAALQRSSRVDVIPSRMHGVDGSIREITSVMSRSVNFANKKRSLSDTVELIANQASTQSGYKVSVIGLPGQYFESVEFGASGESAADAIERLGTILNRSISFNSFMNQIKSSTTLKSELLFLMQSLGGLQFMGVSRTPKLDR